jgi:hypothetical protein
VGASSAAESADGLSQTASKEFALRPGLEAFSNTSDLPFTLFSDPPGDVIYVAANLAPLHVGHDAILAALVWLQGGKMEFRKESFQIERLVKTWRSGSLSKNDEYQRGAAWTQPQMQGLVDSIFRRYPIPPLFLHEIRDEGLGGEVVKRYEIVDGQQRIRALNGYLKDDYPLLEASDKRLRLPNRLRSLPAPHGGKRFADLSTELRDHLLNTSVDVFIITEVANPDEVRDLFIRLQSGTALTRQQIRDAWPGAVGPYMERLAGKLERKPVSGLFGLVDKRGSRSEDDRDQHDADRQFCAQLLCLFLARERDPNAEQSITANDLDKVYHDNTDFPTDGPTAHRFEEALQHATNVFGLTMVASGVNKIKAGARFKKKFKKLDIIAAFFLIQDLTRSPQVKLGDSFYLKLAQHLSKEHDLPAGGRSTSGPTIAAYYTEWRKTLPDLGIRLDPRRAFSEQEKVEMHQRQEGRCAVCAETLTVEEGDGDHYPVAYALGGQTTLDNGRLVHKTLCHARGRAAALPTKA